MFLNLCLDFENLFKLINNIKSTGTNAKLISFVIQNWVSKIAQEEFLLLVPNMLDEHSLNVVTKSETLSTGLFID